MDWGGLIAGAMGGGAQAVGQIADNAIQQRDREAMEIRSENRAIAGEQRRAQFNFDMAEKAADEKLRRYMESFDKTETRAKEIGLERDTKAMELPSGQAGPQVPQDVVESFTPKQRSMYEASGQLQKQTGSGLVMDKITAARDVGAVPELRKELGEEYKGEVRNEQVAAANTIKEREIARKEAEDKSENATRFMQAQAALNQAAAAMKRAEKSGDAQARADAQTNLNTVITTNMKLIEESEKRLMILGKDDPARKTLEERVARSSALIDDAQKGLGGRITGEIDKREKTPAQSVSELPKGAKQIGTSKGKPVYETPDGKRFIGK